MTTQLLQKEDETGGPGFFSMFLMENKSPRFLALWFAIIIASMGIFAPLIPLMSLLNGFLPVGLSTYLGKESCILCKEGF